MITMSKTNIIDFECENFKFQNRLFIFDFFIK